jgi:hypothetical protein
MSVFTLVVNEGNDKKKEIKTMPGLMDIILLIRPSDERCLAGFPAGNTFTLCGWNIH